VEAPKTAAVSIKRVRVFLIKIAQSDHKVAHFLVFCEALCQENTVLQSLMSPEKPTFELCAPTLAAAVAADRGGADRIELCSNLPVGGVTPDENLIASVLASVSIPVHVLIRPRPGDFVFTAEEFAAMRRQIVAARAAGAHGVAIGVLMADGRIDVKRSRELADLARPMNVTFHRAFDVTSNLHEALEAVVQTGADVLLTSGGAADVASGAESIARLRRNAGNRIQVMAGGGLRLANLREIVQRTGVSSVHGSLSAPVSSNGNGHGPDPLEQNVREAVRLLREACAELGAHARIG
jgi:copper homeostasis protein